MQTLLIEIDLREEVKKISFCDLIKIKISDTIKKWK